MSGLQTSNAAVSPLDGTVHGDRDVVLSPVPVLVDGIDRSGRGGVVHSN